MPAIQPHFRKGRTMELTDAQKMVTESPSTFHRPSREYLDAISVGCTVQVSNGYDRFWVLITGVDDRKLAGTIDNILVGPLGQFGDKITFERRHVYQISEGDTR